MSQPPLSRAIKQLETDLGAVLLHRSPTGVTPTPAGAALLDEGRGLLAQAHLVRLRVAAAAGAGTLTVGILGDTTDRGATRPAATYRRQHPGTEVRIREADLADPTCGLRAGLVDVALTRTPFDETSLVVRELSADPVGAVLRADDPLARRDRLMPADLADRRWFRFPDGRPALAVVLECLQAVLWNRTVGMTPLGHHPPGGLTVVPVTDMAPSRVVAAWNAGGPTPLIRSFVHTATATYRH
ncbi:LysR family transcriptional regulator [Streptomyces sp. NPDC059355]|uniref:LysR family transcriptional regulator n=1 Tax=Streptomyces sp. NPDC059355 TaxID=3346811 RepID=UPI00368A5E88